MADTVTDDAGREVVLFHRPGEDPFRDACLRHSGAPVFHAQTLTTADFDDFVARAATLDPQGRPCRHVPPGDPTTMARCPTLVLPDGGLGPFAWRRRTLGAPAYALVGRAATWDAAAPAIGEIMTAPVERWDALVLPTTAMERAGRSLLDDWSRYYADRWGGKPGMPARIAAIPPGVDCDAFAPGPQAERERRTLRRRLGIATDDIAVLAFGPMSLHEAQHPMALYLAVDAAASAAPEGARVFLIVAGWAANEAQEREFRDALRRFAPGVRGIFLDGRDPDVASKVWRAADVYCAFPESAASEPLPSLAVAMAAGLPVVVADWAGAGEFVADGKQGFTVPVWLPPAGSGGDLAPAPEAFLDPELASAARHQNLGAVTQMTAIDVRAAAHALEALLGDAELRREMGEAAAERAREEFDWPAVLRRHERLWADLDEVRREAAKGVHPVPGGMPGRDDPFQRTAELAPQAVLGTTRVALADPEGDPLRRLAAIRRQRMNTIAEPVLLRAGEREQLLAHLANRGETAVATLAELLAEDRRHLVPRTVVWLAKMGLVTLEAGDAVARTSPPASLPDGAAVEPPLPARRESAGNLIELGQAARRRGAQDRAAEYYRAALRNDPENPEVLTRLGELLAANSDFDGAIDHFRRAAAQMPERVEVHLGLGKALFLKGERGEGIAALQRAVELQPDDAEAHYLLGAALRRAGAVNEAARALEAALKRDPKRVDALCHLALVRKSLGRRAEAMQAFRDALRLDPGNVFARAGELSLGVEREGRRRLARDPKAKRVALHLNQRHHFRLMRRLFDGLGEAHWPLISGDGRELQEFDPQVVLVAGSQAKAMRELLPNAVVVHVATGIAANGRWRRELADVDYATATAPAHGNLMVKAGAIAAERVWVTGAIGLDPLFAGVTPDPPTLLDPECPMVLYAPGEGRYAGSAHLLGEQAPALLRGGRGDVQVVIRPHPATLQRDAPLIQRWRRAAEHDDGVILLDDPVADLLPWLAAADVLVADHSSVMFDFLPFDRPLVLIANPERARDTALYDAEGPEWAWREIGEEVTAAADLPAVLGRVLAGEDPQAGPRRQCRALLFEKTGDGGAVERLSERIAGLDM